jgi:DNA polymerase-3 subunit delta'
MMEPSANSFLKTLEEPSPRTLLILITAEPQSLLPTVCSRCQRIVLADSADAVAAPWENTLIELLGDLPPATVTQASGFADRLMALLEELRAGFEVEETARLPEDLSAKEAKALLEARCASRLVGARSEILRTILYWQRDVLLRVLERPAETLYFPDDLEAIDRQAMLCTRAAALQRIAAVDEMNRRFERSLPAEAVLNSFFMQFV